MFRTALGFFLIGLLAYILGSREVGGVSIEEGKTLLALSSVVASFSLIYNILTDARCEN